MRAQDADISYYSTYSTMRACGCPPEYGGAEEIEENETSKACT